MNDTAALLAFASPAVGPCQRQFVFEQAQFSDQDLGARGFGGLARPALDRAAVSHALA